MPVYQQFVASALQLFSYNPAMAFVVFLRGINVGGNRRFRPSVFAKAMADFQVVNVGAAGTFVVRKGSPAKFRAELAHKLPFEADIAICNGRDLIALETENPFGSKPPSKDSVRFLSILSKPGVKSSSVPCAFPPKGDWYVRIIARDKQFVFGVYRRHMKTIGYLGRIDKLFGAPAITRNWNTILVVIQILKTK